MLFVQVAKKDYLEQAKWLLDLDKMKSFIDYYEILDCCCYRNNIRMIQWIFTLEHSDRNRIYEFIFEKSCEYNCLNIINWLKTLKNKQFYYACMTDNKIIATFLIKIHQYLLMIK